MRLIRTANRGLSNARNTGAEAATGEMHDCRAAGRHIPQRALAHPPGARVRFQVVGSDPHRFDGDRDGIGCES